MTKRIIVVVDDDKTLGMIMAAYLKTSFDCEIFFYERASHALREKNEWAKKAKTIMITDVQMPGMQGDKLTKRVKELYPEIKVIMISGIEEKSLSMIAEDSGADVFLKKRFDLDKLVEIVERLML